MPGLPQTVGDLLLECKKMVFGPLGVFIDTLAADCPAGASTVTLSLAKNLLPGSLLDVDCETMLVQAWDAPTQTARVRRGWLRTDRVDHAAADDPIVEVNPRWPAGQLVNDLLVEILSWPDSLYRPDYLDLPNDDPSSTDVVFQVELDDTYNDVMNLTSARWMSVDGRSIGLPKARLVQGPVGVFFIDLGQPLRGYGSLNFVLSRTFLTGTWEQTTLLTDIGLQPSMYDIPPMGVALRRLGLDEIRRSDRQNQGEPRLDQANPANELVGAWAALEKMYDRRLREEGDRLITRFRMRVW